jgi:DNA helicase-2/ATP-dependent DNA helicase PcrA
MSAHQEEFDETDMDSYAQPEELGGGAMEWLDALNPMQRQAVEMPARSCLIVAGAGSGKTKVLTSRVAFLLETGMATPQEILAVTFTNKAAREMVERLEKLGVVSRGMWVGTFHGLCNRFLRKFNKVAGLPSSFQILDVDDSKSLLKRVYKAKGWDEERLPIKEAYSIISERKEEGLRAHTMPSSTMREALAKEVFEAYEERLKAEGSVDFPELLLRTVEILQESEGARFWMQAQFRHVLIDEFQDTNRLQYRWLKLATGQQNPVFAVGDGDQSVYGFRGANVANIEAFVEEFALAPQDVVRMEQNYRSRSNILEAANAVIRNNPRRMDKNLWTDKGPGPLIRVKEALDEAEESGFLGEQADKLRAAGVDMTQVAFLYRTNSQSRAIEHALFKRAIPYRVYGGLRFFERAEVKNAMAFLRLAANPRDDSALLRAISFPSRGVGAKTLEKYGARAVAEGGSLWDAIKAGAAGEGPKLKKALEGFVQTIEEIASAAQTLPLPQAMGKALELSGMLSAYGADDQAQDRLENLRELVSAARGFVEDPIAEDTGLESFLAHAALEAGERGAKEGETAAQLMTVHASKGLEFDHVFLAGMEEGLFPHANALARSQDIEEERRLMYVAITRAREQLTLTRAVERSQFGKFESNRPSRFLSELPEELLELIESERSDHELSMARLKHRSRSEGFDEGRRGRRADFGDTGKGADKIAASFVDPDDPYKEGKKVAHAKFGVGVVKLRIGQGADLAIEVDFGAHGRRRLVVKYAKLSPA